MTTLSEIESAVTHLPPDELSQFRKWFLEFDAAQWDDQIERDVEAGKLDQLAEQALDHLKAGRCKPL